MILRTWIFLFFLALSPILKTLPAQNHLVDSLREEVNSYPEDDEEKVKLLTRLAFEYRTLSPDESRRIAQEIRSVSLKIGYRRGVGLSDQIIGISHSIQGEYALALNSYILALDVFRSINDSVAIGKNLSNIAGIYYNWNNWSQAEKYSEEALEIVIHNEAENSLGVATTALGLGLIKVQLGKYAEAQDLYQLAQKIFLKENNSQRVGMVLSSMGELYEAKNDYSRAMYYMREALSLKEEINDQVGQANTLLHISRLYTKQGQYTKAEGFLKRSKEIAEELGLNQVLKGVYYRYKELALLRKNYQSAYKYQELYMAYKDSISLESNSKVLEKLQMAYSIESDRQKTRLIEKDRELKAALLKEQESTIRNQKILNAAITLVAISMLILVISLLINRRKIKQTNEMLKDERAENKNKQLELEELNKTKDKWFAMMCHDFKQPLTFMLGALDLLNEGKLSAQEHKMLLLEMEDRAKTNSSMLDNLLFWAQDQQHGIVVRKERLDMEVIMSENLFLLDSAIKKKGINVQMEMGHRSLVWADRHMLHLITKNLLENAIKLSKSHEKIRIYSELMENKLCIHIADSGVSIPQKYLDKLFQFDSRRILEGFAKERGLGINLLVARDFIEKNGGRIWARNVSDLGNVFSYCLPYAGDFQGNEEFEMLFVE